MKLRALRLVCGFWLLGAGVIRGEDWNIQDAVTGEMLDRQQLEQTVPGILVSQVFPDSDAERGGFQPGDMIVAAYGLRVMSQSEYVLVCQERAGDGLKHDLIMRRGGQLVRLQPRRKVNRSGVWGFNYRDDQGKRATELAAQFLNTGLTLDDAAMRQLRAFPVRGQLALQECLRKGGDARRLAEVAMLWSAVRGVGKPPPPGKGSTGDAFLDRLEVLCRRILNHEFDPGELFDPQRTEAEVRFMALCYPFPAWPAAPLGEAHFMDAQMAEAIQDRIRQGKTAKLPGWLCQSASERMGLFRTDYEWPRFAMYAVLNPEMWGGWPYRHGGLRDANQTREWVRDVDNLKGKIDEPVRLYSYISLYCFQGRYDQALQAINTLQGQSPYLAWVGFGYLQTIMGFVQELPQDHPGRLLARHGFQSWAQQTDWWEPFLSVLKQKLPDGVDADEVLYTLYTGAPWRSVECRDPESALINNGGIVLAQLVGELRNWGRPGGIDVRGLPVGTGPLRELMEVSRAKGNLPPEFQQQIQKSTAGDIAGETTKPSQQSGAEVKTKKLLSEEKIEELTTGMIPSDQIDGLIKESLSLNLKGRSGEGHLRAQAALELIEAYRRRHRDMDVMDECFFHFEAAYAWFALFNAHRSPQQHLEAALAIRRESFAYMNKKHGTNFDPQKAGSLGQLLEQDWWRPEFDLISWELLRMIAESEYFRQLYVEGPIEAFRFAEAASGVFARYTSTESAFMEDAKHNLLFGAYQALEDMGDDVEAERLASRSVELYPDHAYLQMGLLAVRARRNGTPEGEVERLQRLYREWLDRGEPPGSLTGWELEQRVELLWFAGRREEALDAIMREFPTQGESPLMSMEIHFVCRTLEWMLEMGRTEEMERTFQGQLKHCRELGWLGPEARLRLVYADYQASQGNWSGLIPLAVDAERLYRQWDLIGHALLAKARQANAFAQLGQAERAVELWAEIWKEQSHAPHIAAVQRLQLLLRRLSFLDHYGMPEERGRNVAALLQESETWPLTAHERALLASRRPAGAPAEMAGGGSAEPGVDFQPVEVLTSVKPGEPASARVLLYNLSAAALEGSLRVTGRLQKAHWDKERGVLSVLLDEAAQGSTLQRELQLEGREQAVVDLGFDRLPPEARGEVLLSWESPGATASSRWRYDATEEQQVLAVVNANAIHANPFYGISLFHQIYHRGEGARRVPLRVRSKQPCRLEIYNAATDKLLAVDNQGDGDYRGMGDVVYVDADHDSTPEVEFTESLREVRLEIIYFQCTTGFSQSPHEVVVELKDGEKWAEYAASKVNPPSETGVP